MAANTETREPTHEGETGTNSGRNPAPAFAPGDFMDRTFMGGTRLSSRTSLFVVIGLVCLAIGGFGLFRAQQDLGAARRNVASAYELARLVETVEATAMRIRAEGILATQNHTAATPQSSDAIDAHISKAVELGHLLDNIYIRFGGASLGEHLTTVREAIAQYAETYGALAAGAAGAAHADSRSGPAAVADQAEAVQAAAGDLQTRLGDVNILSLDKAVADMREAEAAFMKNGQAGDLIAIAKNQDSFLRMLSMVPLGETDAGDLRKLMTIYQNRLTEYAKRRISIPETTGRLDEIFSYMTPSINALRANADQRLAASLQKETSLRDLYLPLIASIGAGLMLVVLLSGALILRSVTAPIIAAAEAGRRIAGGENDVVVWGLGNDDETGDIARALSVLKLRLGEIVGVRESLEKERSEAERGRAATEEAAWLRHDLESLKAETAKGLAAIDEVELLHKVIEAMKSNYQENAAASIQAAAPENIKLARNTAYLSVDQPAEMPSLDTISQISQQVAQSSQTVTAAAEEAERTGTLIRNLNDASRRIAGIEAQIKAIGEQADLLRVGAPGGGPGEAQPGGNLVMFTDPRGEGDPVSAPGMDRSQMESSIGRRFDVIRATASQITWALRDINGVILEARSHALTIAQTTSAEALHVTTNLLEQSENLRFMLDSLVHKMRDQLFDEDDDGDETGSGDQDVS